MKKPREYKIVIFDLDGTLVDAYAAIIESFHYTMSRVGGKRLDDKSIRRAVGGGDRNLLKPYLNGADLKRAHGIYQKHHMKNIPKLIKLLPGAAGLLKDLKAKGVKMAVASNRPGKFARLIVRSLGLNRYFDYVLAGDQVKKAKPDPEMLREILKKLRLRTEEALYVGDMTIDVLTGQRARIKTFAVATGSSARKELERSRPFRVVRDLKELSGVFRRINLT